MMRARSLFGRAIRLEGGFGEVDKASGVLDIFWRCGSEFPPAVRKPNLDEAARGGLDKDGARPRSGAKRIEQ
jgi:hypothetical protein